MTPPNRNQQPCERRPDARYPIFGREPRDTFSPRIDDRRRDVNRDGSGSNES